MTGPLLQQFSDEEDPAKRRISSEQIEAAKRIGAVVVFSIKQGRLKIEGESTKFAQRFAKLMKR